MRLVFTLLVLATLCPALAEAPSATVLQAAWARTESARKAHIAKTISIENADLAKVAQGEIAKRRIRTAGADRGVGIAWTSLPREPVWLAILDDTHDTLISSLHEERLPTAENGRKRLYQFLNLPWPFQDRHWALEIWNSGALAAATDNRLWERTWQLLPESTAPSQMPEAIWTPVNDGGWLLLEVGGGTLLVYHARTLVGGNIPDELATRWAMAILDDMLSHVIARAGEIPAHYGPTHKPINGGDDIRISAWPRAVRSDAGP